MFLLISRRISEPRCHLYKLRRAKHFSEYNISLSFPQNTSCRRTEFCVHWTEECEMLMNGRGFGWLAGWLGFSTFFFFRGLLCTVTGVGGGEVVFWFLFHLEGIIEPKSAISIYMHCGTRLLKIISFFCCFHSKSLHNEMWH